MPDLPSVEIKRVKELLLDHGTKENAAYDFWLVCSFYQRPKQLKALGFDPGRSREVLSQAVSTAQRLLRTIGKLSPEVMAVPYLKRVGVENVLHPGGPRFLRMQEELADFSRVAMDAAQDLQVPEGRL